MLNNILQFQKRKKKHPLNLNTRGKLNDVHYYYISSFFWRYRFVGIAKTISPPEKFPRVRLSNSSGPGRMLWNRPKSWRASPKRERKREREKERERAEVGGIRDEIRPRRESYTRGPTAELILIRRGPSLYRVIPRALRLSLAPFRGPFRSFSPSFLLLPPCHPTPRS